MASSWRALTRTKFQVGLIDRMNCQDIYEEHSFYHSFPILSLKGPAVVLTEYPYKLREAWCKEFQRLINWLVLFCEHSGQQKGISSEGVAYKCHIFCVFRRESD